MNRPSAHLQVMVEEIGQGEDPLLRVLLKATLESPLFAEVFLIAGQYHPDGPSGVIKELRDKGEVVKVDLV